MFKSRLFITLILLVLSVTVRAQSSFILSPQEGDVVQITNTNKLTVTLDVNLFGASSMILEIYKGNTKVFSSGGGADPVKNLLVKYLETGDDYWVKAYDPSDPTNVAVTGHFTMKSYFVGRTPYPQSCGQTQINVKSIVDPVQVSQGYSWEHRYYHSSTGSTYSNPTAGIYPYSNEYHSYLNTTGTYWVTEVKLDPSNNQVYESPRVKVVGPLTGGDKNFQSFDDPVTLVNDLGGTWSGNGVSGNTFNPQLANSGANTLTYSWCGPSETVTYTINKWLSAPNGSETFAKGETIPVSLDLVALDPGSVQVDLYKNTQQVSSIIMSTGTPLNFPLGTSLIPGNDYWIKVLDPNNPTKSDQTPQFSITEPGPSLTTNIDGCGLVSVIVENGNTLGRGSVDKVNHRFYASSTGTSPAFGKDAYAIGNGVFWSSNQISSNNFTYWVSEVATDNSNQLLFESKRTKVEVTPSMFTTDAGENMDLLTTASTVSLSSRGFPSGGEWSGPGVLNGVFHGSMAGIGDHILTYTACGVSSTATFNVSEIDTEILSSSGWVVEDNQSLNLSIAESSYDNYKWMKDGVVIQNGSQNQVAITEAGIYSVEITHQGIAYNSEPVLIAKRQSITSLSLRDRTADLESSTSTSEAQKAINYLDGLGRSDQSILVGHTQSNKDLIQTFEYDLSNASISYLPYVGTNGSGDYRINADQEQASFYATSQNDISQTNFPYNTSIFDGTALNRIVEQASPGEDWQPGTGNTMTFSYSTNQAFEVVRWSHTDLTNWVGDYYKQGELTKTSTVDEDGNTLTTFTDERENVILKRSKISETQWADTYYIYDDLDRLITVLQPEAIAHINQNLEGVSMPNYNVKYLDYTLTQADDGTSVASINSTATIPAGVTLGPGSLISSFNAAIADETVDDFAFKYKYDDRGRMIEKIVPGAEPVYMVYDQWDRLVLTQDGNQRLSDEWLFTKYDWQNRPILTGKKVIPGALQSIRDLANDPNAIRNEILANGPLEGYSNNTYPSVSSSDLMTVAYYDNYDFVASSSLQGTLFQQIYTTSDPFHVLPVQNTQVKGQVTGTLTSVGNGGFITTITYYDDKYRPIQIVNENHLGGTDVISNQFDFTGNIRKTQIAHTNNGVITTVKRRYSYDHSNRLLNTYHEIDSNGEQLISENAYNELGEVITKRLHDGEQELDYAYNIRGWLTRINESDLSASDDGDLFGMELFYNTADASGDISNPTYYSGNISAIKWSTLNDQEWYNTEERAYRFQYDGLNRLENAQSNMNTAGWRITDDYRGEYSYDRNGNINTLNRRNNKGVHIDMLSYTYKGNQLERVTDGVTNTLGFNDKHTGSIDYTYDDNGNMISDANKGITNIEYNHLNLPTKVTFDAQNYIEYVYNAAGIKLQQKVWQDDTLRKTTDYVGEFIYEDGVAQLIQHSEGRIIPKIEKEAEDIAWTFDSDDEGFTVYSDVSNFAHSASGHIEGTFDGPWSRVISPANLDIEAVKYDRIRIRLENNSNKDKAYIYFNTSTQSGWNSGRAILFDIQPNSGYQDYVIDMTQANTHSNPSNHWTGTVTQIGIDIQFATGDFKIDEVVVVANTLSETYDYQYHLKDHLGNVRLTFSTTPENYTMVETFETGEDNGFQNLHRTHNSHVNTTPGGNEVERLLSGQTGAMVFLNLDKGDTIDLHVNANYDGAIFGTNTFLETSYGSLFSTFTNSFGGNLQEGVTASSSDFNSALSGTGMVGKDDPTTESYAFLNYILFDEEMNYLTAGYKQVSELAAYGGLNPIENVRISGIVADRRGYILAYLSNENSVPLPMRFDDFTVVHKKTNVVSTQDYYPFGLTFNESARVASSPQQYLYSGKEFQKETGWHDFGERMFDTSIGRWMAVDRLAINHVGMSPYNYALNNPLRYIDPDGATPWDVLQTAMGYLNTPYQWSGKNPYYVGGAPASVNMKRINTGMVNNVYWSKRIYGKDFQNYVVDEHVIYRGNGADIPKEYDCGVDCSGLATIAFNSDPDKLMRDFSIYEGANNQKQAFIEASRGPVGTGYLHQNFNKLVMGDLVFMEYRNGYAHHVMVATGLARYDSEGNVVAFQVVHSKGGEGVRYDWYDVGDQFSIGHTFRRNEREQSLLHKGSGISWDQFNSWMTMNNLWDKVTGE